MEETQLINYLSIMILAVINLGGIARIIFCLINLNNADSERQMKQRIKNIIIFLIVANCIFSIIAYTRSFYGG